MRKRMIFAAGVGVGYVLGTRAGRERFDQMVGRARQLWESPTVQEAAGVVQAQATKLYDTGRQAVIDQVNRRVRHDRSPDANSPTGWDLPEAEIHPGDPASRRTKSSATAS